MLQENDIRNSVLDKIHSGKVSMHSRLYFKLRAALVNGVLLIIFILSLFALSFILFSIQEINSQYLLGFGERGLLTFAAIFPWLMLLLSVVLLVALETLLRQFKSGYRLPALRLFLWAMIIGVAGGALIELTPLHSQLLQEAERNQLPILGPLYGKVSGSYRSGGVYTGTVTAITSSMFVVSSDDGAESWTIVPPIGFDMSSLSIGENMYAAGTLTDGTVYAYGIRRIPDEQ